MRLIDADELMQKARFYICNGNDTETAIPFESIRNAPTIDAIPVVHARIEEVIVANGAGIELVCSACKQMAFPSNDYCPHCGAKFDLDIKEDR